MNNIKEIFVIGQCTLHWGRMEFGNVGNFYIIEPFFRELHRVFTSARIKTTFQMSETFRQNENIRCVPMSEYYAWEKDDLDNAYKELALATIFKETNSLLDTTPFIEDVLSSDLVVDFSGDIWGANADLVGENRFLVGLLKDRVVQLLGKKIAMIAGSPGPFNRDSILPFAKEVFSNFNIVTNREPISRKVLSDYGLDNKNMHDLACPAFMFEPASQEEVFSYIAKTPLVNKSKPVVGFVLCGWNMLQGPFNREDWRDEEFVQYVELIKHMVHKYNVNFCLMSHSNGFLLPPNFKPIKGRDFPIVEKLYHLLQNTDISDNVFLMDDVYSPKITKGIIANLDMLISGRVHGAVAGLSQNVPTVIIDYGHEPKAHKLRGFAKVADVEEFVANPAELKNLIKIAEKCWTERANITTKLAERNKYIINQIHKNFDLLREI